MWLLNLSNVGNVIEKLNFRFYYILINLHSHMVLVATEFDNKV